MLSRHARRRLNQFLSVILCLTILVQSSPLPIWPYYQRWQDHWRTQEEMRRPATGLRIAQAASLDDGIIPQAPPTPSAAPPATEPQTAGLIV